PCGAVLAPFLRGMPQSFQTRARSVADAGRGELPVRHPLREREWRRSSCDVPFSIRGRWSGDRGFGRNGERGEKCVSTPFAGGDPDRSAVRGCCTLGNRQADAGSGSACRGRGSTVITVEDSFAIRGRNDVAEAVHREEHFHLRPFGAHRDWRFCVRILARVIKILGEKHGDQTPVTGKRKLPGNYLDANFIRRGALAQGSDNLIDEGSDWNLLQLQRRA